MKCPFRVDTNYPGREEYWGRQHWSECDGAECPLFIGGTCARVQQINAQRIFFSETAPARLGEFAAAAQTVAQYCQAVAPEKFDGLIEAVQNVAFPQAPSQGGS